MSKANNTVLEELLGMVKTSRKFAAMLKSDAGKSEDQSVELAAVLQTFQTFERETSAFETELFSAPKAGERSRASLKHCIDFYNELLLGLELFQARIFAILLKENKVLKRRPRAVLTKSEVFALDLWAERNNYALPTAKEKQELAEQMDLSVEQISTWFANAKARKWNGGNKMLAMSTDTLAPNHMLDAKRSRTNNNNGVEDEFKCTEVML